MLVIEKPLLRAQDAFESPLGFSAGTRCFSAVFHGHVTPGFRNGLNYAANFKARDYKIAGGNVFVLLKLNFISSREDVQLDFLGQRSERRFRPVACQCFRSA